MTNEEIVKLVQSEVKKATDALTTKSIHRTQLLPKVVKSANIDGFILQKGLEVNLPVSNSTGIDMYFATDTGILYIFDGTDWLSVTLT